MPDGPLVALVEDDALLRTELGALLDGAGYRVRTYADAESLLDDPRWPETDLLLTDILLPGDDGISLVRKVHEARPGLPILVMTGFGSVETAVDAMSSGAFHYVTKPFSPKAMIGHVARAVEHGRMLAEQRILRQAISNQAGLGRIVGKSDAIERMRANIREIAPTRANVLVTGETGTGKELVVSALHFESPRAGNALVKVNCAALSETLLESELFGHEKGAFTGAERARRGRFEKADGGTLFLDEITEMSERTQAKLLRVLQGEPFERVGGDVSLRPEVRVIAATNRDPEQAVQSGHLRRDLYFRLNVFRVDIPPLRDRLDDIPHLAGHFSEVFAEKYGKAVPTLPRETLSALKRYSWPGNVRELQNMVERAVALSSGHAFGQDILSWTSGEQASDTLPRELEYRFSTLNLAELERLAILKALEESGWNKARAAERLGIFPSALFKRLKRLEIPYRPE